MTKKTIVGFIVFMLEISCLFSQDISMSSSDSLNHWVESQLISTPDTSKVYKIAHLSLFLSIKENNQAGLIIAFQNLVMFHKQYGQLDSAIYYLNSLKAYYKNTGMKNEVAETCLSLKDLFSSKAAYAEAMVEVYEALDLYEEMDMPQGIALCYTHICDLLYYEDKYEESVNYCDKAIAIQKQIDAKKDLAISLRYKASSQLFIEGALEEALKTVNKSIGVYHQIGETAMPLMASINGRGNILKYMKRYDEAIADYQFIYEHVMEMGLANYAIPALANIGHVYIMQKKYREALPYHLKALDLMKESGNTKNLWENYMHISDIYEGLGDYKKAFDYNKLYSKEYSKYLHSIIDRLESETQIKYETAKKDEMINAQETTIVIQRKVQILYISIALLLLISLMGMFRSRKNIRRKQKEIELSKEKLQQSLVILKETQSQLIHSEKMASLGELTAGIAHEIQNPLNFVNNFSELNAELISDLKDEIRKGDMEEVIVIANDIAGNEEKIKHHGKRAEAIVKGMLQHSRSSNDKKEPVNINTLADEYLRLAYHGLRAKDKRFNADFKTDFDELLPEIFVVPQDIGRVLLNLINNAFYACAERSKSAPSPEALAKEDANYKPTVIVHTKKLEDKIEIKVSDNGKGIPDAIKKKIFQPFFTTKPTGEGTGLGLSLSYDIITKGHGGEIKVESNVGDDRAAGKTGTVFIIVLPIK